MRPLLALAAFSLAASGQGIPVRSFEPAPKLPPSGRPWPVRFTSVTAPAGLTAPFLAGLPRPKKYIHEANGAGLAIIDDNNHHNP
ncbi:MAG: CRTAC1 family protein, partial [Acidobacteriota bacterium]